MLKPIIQEDLLHYIWKTKNFDFNGLRTTDGQAVEIVSFGYHNHDAGPDFSHAKIMIDGIQWVGNVEMHVYSKDWDRHTHDLDERYDNVILHVVYEHDGEVFTSQERRLPTIELKSRIPKNLLHRYRSLIDQNSWIPCEPQIQEVDQFTLSMWQERLIAERLEEKSKYILSIWLQNNKDWDETTYILMARYMGSKVNRDPFENLARVTPYKMILKNTYEHLKVEALLFGQAGFLNSSFKDDYPTTLKKEYQFLAAKYKLKPMDVISWKFSRMRPSGFPTIRLAQFATILCANDRLFSLINELQNVNDIYLKLCVTTSEYWDNHYRFDVLSKQKKKKLTKAFADLIIINVWVPILFSYGIVYGEESRQNQAIQLLNQLKAEKNSIIDRWASLNITSKHAADSQALIHLKTKYCDYKACLNCAIGNKLLNKL